MSIQSEIERIRQNVVNAYEAVLEKGGDVPERANSENLASSIRAIPSGGAGGPLSIRVDAPPGSTVTATKDGIIYTAKEKLGTWEILIPVYGIYVVKAVLGNNSTSLAVNVEPFSVSLTYTPQVYGVMWDQSNTNSALTRLTSENDSNRVVNTYIAQEPVSAIGTTRAGSSPFDSLMPWSGMEQYNIINNDVSHRRGQSGFSQTKYDTMVYIPEFWYRVVQSGTKWWWYISDRQKDGFEKHPGSGRYVGRYNTSGTGTTTGYTSKSGSPVRTGITRAQARSGSRSKGANWYQYDYATWCAIWLLYLVEYANWNSQIKIGYGITNDSSTHNSGQTDAMAYHTGRPDGEDGKTAVQYRWIENPFGNVNDYVDGINFGSRAAYISLDNDNFGDDTASGYINSGVTLPSANNYISKIGYSSSLQWAFLPNESEGSSTTKIPDYIYSGSGARIFVAGGDFARGDLAGFFAFGASYESSNSSDRVGARLIYIPK